MLRSLYSGISGMKVNQSKLDVIGNNIANVGTTSFKSGRVRFKDMMSQNSAAAMSPSSSQGGTNPQQIGLGVQVAGIDTIVSQGSMQPTSNPLDAAIDGEGYFVVSKGAKTFDSTGIKVDASHNTTVTNGSQLMYSRDGAFALDSEGNLLTSDGYRVLGYTVTGIVPATTPTAGVCQVPIDTTTDTSISIQPPSSAAATTISFTSLSDLVSSINSDPLLGALYTASSSGSNLVLTQKTGKEGSTAPTISGVTGASTTVTSGVATIPAPAIKGIYKIDSLATPLVITPGGSTTPVTVAFTDIDNLVSNINSDATLKNYYTASKDSSNNLILTQNKGTESSTGPTVTSGGTLTALLNGSVAGTDIISPNSIDSNGDVIFADANNTITADSSSLKTLRIPDVIYQNATDAANGVNGDKVLSFSIEKDGQIKAVLASGKVSAIGQIAMASFKNPGGLEKMGKNLYSVSANSGSPTLRSGAYDKNDAAAKAADNSGSFGDMMGNTLEMSNVDLAEQFTEMIVASRAFQANGKTISTGDEVLQSIINLVR